MFNIIFFDLDGTLTNPEKGITTCVQYALESFGIIEPDNKKLTPFIGPPLKECFMGIYGLNDVDADRAVEKYRERFSTVGLYENEILAGIPQMLQTLREAGKTMAVVTAKPYVYAVEILKHFDILKYFDEVFGPSFDELHIGKSIIVERAVNHYGKENICHMVMVGDRKMDIEGAKHNSITSVGVRFGFAEEDELEDAGADYIADTGNALSEILMK